tara:strand:- start:5285 stop:6259 length:975 start_codon:yes stop_codon:yes gene_type:complete
VSNLKKKIIIIGGDPNSINSEIIYKCWKKLSESLKKRIYIVANYELLKEQLRQLNYSIKLIKVKNIFDISKKNQLKVINVDLKFKKPFNVPKKNAAPYVRNCLNLGHDLGLNKYTAGLINCPINKNLLLKKNTGITEFLASKCKLKDNSEVMMIKSKNFSVCPITTHLNLKDISKNIKKKLIITKIKTIKKYYIKLFGKNPKIAVLGLNPHNAELKKKSEEVRQIIPAISYLKKLNFNIKGPLVADTIFIEDYKNYDVIVGMYHDQILAPFKTIFKFDAINVTLGLKYLRLSPDHGVALNIIKKNKANPLSLFECIKFVNKFRI